MTSWRREIRRLVPASSLRVARPEILDRPAIGGMMMTIRLWLKLMAALALLGLLSSACGAQAGSNDAAPATVIAEHSRFSDPFTYCQAVDTIDAPDERYVGVPVPEAVVADLRGKAGISEDAPDAWIEAGTVWRCMDGEVWACFTGANLPCSEKADASTTPQPQMADFCRTNLDAETIPVAVAGRATIYEWGCVGGDPQVVKQILRTDSQGYLSDFWYELNPQ